MNRLLLFGASGNLGKEVARVAHQEGYEVTAVVRHQQKAAQLKAVAHHCIIADVTNPQAIKGICKGFDLVVSALGKSVSPTDRSKPSFYDVDLTANSHILEEAKKSGIKKFVYVSALHAEHYQHLTYCKVHHQFSEKLQQSGINYAIIKPPGIFSAFVEMIDMARKGRLVSIGKGDKKTNPIAETDLAQICVDALKMNNVTIEAGGQNVYTRRQLLEIIQQEVAPDKKVRTVPLGLVKSFLPLIKLANRNLFDKMAFFTTVMEVDTIAPQVGATSFEEYIRAKAQK